MTQYRNTYLTYELYLKKRTSSHFYNKGLWLQDPSGGHDISGAVIAFQRAICEDKYNEDAKYQLSLIRKATAPSQLHTLQGAACILDCSGCKNIFDCSNCKTNC